ncbi:zincin-like metallopeptidase domain-containing protein, partial [Bacillus cereus]
SEVGIIHENLLSEEKEVAVERYYECYEEKHHDYVEGSHEIVNYSTLFHEFIHSTGHSNRLHRDGITSATAHFGSEEYSKEELVA